MTLQYAKSERIWLRTFPALNEAWVQQRIAEDPSLLGLGDVVLRDKERRQHAAGRLDLLLQDADSNRRYEVEVQLGKTDESHIVRTIEYWDIERRRYPQYDHCAVIVAEEITSRFLNVIGLFNGSIPLIALQMSDWRLGDTVSLVFTRVLDELTLGLVDEDEETQEVTDRAYWEAKGTSATIGMADELLEMIHTFESSVQLKYNKFYIGLERNGKADNFAVFRVKKKHLILQPRLPKSEEIDRMLEEGDLDVMGYDVNWERYKVRLTPPDIRVHKDLITKLLQQAYEHSSG